MGATWTSALFLAVIATLVAVAQVYVSGRRGEQPVE
jgi:hypothetical protein